MSSSDAADLRGNLFEVLKYLNDERDAAEQRAADARADGDHDLAEAYGVIANRLSALGKLQFLAAVGAR